MSRKHQDKHPRKGAQQKPKPVSVKEAATANETSTKNHVFYSLFEKVLFTALCGTEDDFLLVHFADENSYKLAKKTFEEKYAEAKPDLKLDDVKGLENSFWLPIAPEQVGLNNAKTDLLPELMFLNQQAINRKFPHFNTKNPDELSKVANDFYDRRNKLANEINHYRSAN